MQAVRGVAYGRSRGIVHRDVKPANLLLARDGYVKLADLGLAQFLTPDAAAAHAAKEASVGTPAFMAPEQAESSHQVDARSDLYSLGATLYHLLTGALPFGGTSYLQQLQQLLSCPPRPLAEVRPELPAKLATVVDRLRSRAPAARPASPTEVIALLGPLSRLPADDDGAAH